MSALLRSSRLLLRDRGIIQIARGKLATHSSSSWFVENYPVTYLIVVVGSGVCAMFGYTAYVLAKNPDIRFPFTRQPRNELYFNRRYPGALPDYSGIVPPVRMRFNGDLEFPYDEPSTGSK
ncbi:unnamed protein product [Calicophoron daubneyi]|uniref:Uncharacterized protein n=1 Tax=Calicophoron daubneyi TaxID=300641 RepID=A0AAV2TAJ0_CALDB